MPDSTLAVIDEMILGLSLAIDRNQFGNIKYVTADSLNSDIALLSSRPATVIGAAITLPVYRTAQYTLGTYA
jgi:hypothetical protein